jgi:pyruvate dehydrogenase E2 component (dihydrolipoamide acetyltransferase)
MPSLGAGMESGVLVAWKVAPGDRVRRGDIVAEIETEKGVIEIEIFEDATIEALIAEAGTKLPVGAPLARLGAAREKREAPIAPPVPKHLEEALAREPEAPRPPLERPHRETPAARQLAREVGIAIESLRGTGPHEVVTRSDVLRAAAAQPRLGHELDHLAAAPTRARVSPAARRRAHERGIDLRAIAPGPDGAVHLREVEAAAPVRTADAASAMRRAIAAAMSRSKREIPHYYLAHPIDLGPALEWLERENARRSIHERLLAGVLLLKAVALALKEVPELNAHWLGESAPPVADVHLGVAIALRGGGLVAPAIHRADAMPLDALMRAFKDLVQRTRRATIRGSELAGATITVTSLGERGVETLYPIINPPQVAMVGFGRILERPWVVGGAVCPRPVITATLAADHRVSDGHRGGLFLAEVERLLLHPEEL